MARALLPDLAKDLKRLEEQRARSDGCEARAVINSPAASSTGCLMPAKEIIQWCKKIKRVRSRRLPFLAPGFLRTRRGNKLMHRKTFMAVSIRTAF
jgi:hypothetical protein